MEFEKVRKEHILKAIKDYQEKGLPKGFGPSSTYDIYYKDESYPPKAIMAYANYHATGEKIKATFMDRTPTSLIFYLFNYSPLAENGIIGLNRFYGFSQEPGKYAAYILPTIFMAKYLNMKKCMYILIFALIVVSSYWAFMVLILSLFIYYINSEKNYNIIKFKKFFVVTSFILLVLFIANSQYILFSVIPDLFSNLYAEERLNYYTFWMDKFINDRLYEGIIGYSMSILYLFPCYIFLRLGGKLQIKKPIFYSFFFSSILMLNKSPATITPLLLFYLSFLIFIYKDKNENSQDNSYKVNE